MNWPSLMYVGPPERTIRSARASTPPRAGGSAAAGGGRGDVQARGRGGGGEERRRGVRCGRRGDPPGRGREGADGVGPHARPGELAGLAGDGGPHGRKLPLPGPGLRDEAVLLRERLRAVDESGKRGGLERGDGHSGEVTSNEVTSKAEGPSRQR